MRTSNAGLLSPVEVEISKEQNPHATAGIVMLAFFQFIYVLLQLFYRHQRSYMKNPYPPNMTTTVFLRKASSLASWNV